MSLLSLLPFTGTFRAYWNQVYSFIFHPSSLLVAGLMIAQFILAGAISVSFPFMFRNYVLPSSIQNVVPLDFEFSPCADDLHGVCSFPTSSIDLVKSPLFDENVYYRLSVRLQFADVETNYRLGLFQNQLTLYNNEGKKVKQWRKSSFLRQPGFLAKCMQIVFFPFYIMGFFHDYNNLEITFVEDFYLFDLETISSISFSLQDKFAQLDYASLVVHARLGLVRHFLYHWPILSFLVMFISTFTVLSCGIIVYWSAQGITHYLSKEKETRMEIPKVRADYEEVKQEEKRKKELATVKEVNRIQKKPVVDEFIPRNVDEIPECPILHDIPGWNVNKNTSPLSSGQSFGNDNLVRFRK